ncbi:MAG: U32 family peptidase [Bacteroidales bacterium]|nr:U32 family peptidase [Bacteroidales bacterium]
MQLELLAPAGTRDIGIAAIDCGADAVYIAGPHFGARQAAGNPVAEVGELARYAHRFGAKVYAVVNTILFDDELEAARGQMVALAEAGVDAFIIQDFGILKMDLPAVPLFASTQTAIRTPEDAMRLEALGFKRLILERQLSLDQIRAIRAAVQCDLEFFVHGALCVSYSGHCYLSQALAGRSANRGACVQACRSRYNRLDGEGRVLLRDRSLLSLRDFRLDERLGDLIAAGISSFKIEGRLKNASYVKNVVRHYRAQLDAYLAAHPEHARASAGTPVGGFTPDIDATFNRGYTQAWLDGRRGAWNSVDAAKSLGAYLGTITAIEGNTIEINTSRTLTAGDGLAFIPREGELTGMRVESVSGRRVRLKSTAGLYRGQKVYRNLDSALERELERNMPHRLIDAVIDYRTAGGRTTFTARVAEPGGQTAEVSFAETADVARNPETALETLRSQLSKTTEPYRFTQGKVEGDAVYFYPAAFLNGIRRQMSAALADNKLNDRELHNSAPLENGGATSNNQLTTSGIAAKGDAGDGTNESTRGKTCGGVAPLGALDYRANCANHLAKEVLEELGAESVAPAYELEAPRGAEVMRTRYCIKHELGLCPKQHPAKAPREPLWLENNGTRLKLEFDCKNCEMVVIL